MNNNSAPTTDKDARTITFYDVLDPTRLVRPIEVRGKHLLCKVFFKSRATTVYVGKTELPAKLFDERDKRNPFIGFLPERMIEASDKAAKPERRGRGRRPYGGRVEQEERNDRSY